MGIKLISHNVRGFNSPQKQKKAFSAYKRLRADIIFIQETHFSDSNHPSYFDNAYGPGYFTTFGAKSRGVAIFIKRSLMFDIENVYRDPDSRFLILQGSMQGRKLTIANVYAPNGSQATFFKNFFQVLDKFSSPHCSWGGL